MFSNSETLYLRKIIDPLKRLAPGPGGPPPGGPGGPFGGPRGPGGPPPGGPMGPRGPGGMRPRGGCCFGFLVALLVAFLII